MSQYSSQAPTPSGHSQSGSRNSQRPACARCGSRRWRRENNRGVLICSEGHVLEGYLRESTEQTEASQHSTRVRRIKVGKTRKEYYVRKQVYRGEHSRLLLLQIFTILIRKQAEALIEVLQAPAVLEEVVHAFWRAYLTTLSLDTNLLLSSRPSSPASTSHFAESQSGYSSDESRWSNARHGSQSHPSSPARSFPDDPGVSLTPEALKAMTENESDSSDESDSSRPDQRSQSDDDSQRTPQPGSRRRWQRHDDSMYPRIVYTLGILYLACIRLRLPIIMQDLINLVITKDLPYIGFLATIPELYSFHGHSLINICHKLASRLREVDPSLLPIAESVPNISSIILRFSQIFILPSPIHALALHMISRLKPEYLRLSNSLNASSTTPRSRSRTNTENTRFPTDWFVMASLVTTIKIVLDGVHKHCLPHSLFQLFRKSLPPPKEWTAAIISLRDSVELKNPQRLCEIDMVSASAEELDAYIDLAERFLMNDTIDTTHAALEDVYFPLSPQAPKPVVAEDRASAYAQISAGLLATVTNEYETREGFTEQAAELVSVIVDRASSVVGAQEKDFRHVLELVGRAFEKSRTSGIKADHGV